ncbi:MAG: hypothetical protein AB1726_10770 [Planctomycetota bacterium]
MQIRFLMCALLLLLCEQTAQSQCQPNPSQGNAFLYLDSESAPPGINAPGSTSTLTVAGQPFSRVIIAVDDTPGPTYTGLGTLYLGPDPLLLADGFGFPLFLLDSNGEYRLPLVVPPDPLYWGFSYFFQSAVHDGLQFHLSNGVSVIVGDHELLWEEGFEGYACGSFPAAEWTSWANSGVVDCNEAFTGTHSFRAEGSACSFWGGGGGRLLETCQSFFLDFRVLLRDDGCSEGHTHKLHLEINDGPNMSRLTLFGTRRLTEMGLCVERGGTCCAGPSVVAG